MQIGLVKALLAQTQIGDVTFMEAEKRRIMDRIFNPRGMALFGGIGTPGAFGYLIALSNIRYGYKGAL